VPGWNKDEERATDGGHFDQRPVLMVRFPRQPGANPRANPRANPANPGAVNIDRPQSEMIAHSLVLDLIEGNVRTPEEWIAALPAGVPAPSQAD
jgi:hypothetical protein